MKVTYVVALRNPHCCQTNEECLPVSIRRAFADTVTPALKMFLAVPAGDGSRYDINDHSHGFKEGKELAKNHKAAFVQVSHSFKTQSKALLSMCPTETLC